MRENTLQNPTSFCDLKKTRITRKLSKLMKNTYETPTVYGIHGGERLNTFLLRSGICQECSLLLFLINYIRDSSQRN